MSETAAEHHDPYLAHHFQTHKQQLTAQKLGMWLFLATEVLLFGGLFVAYAVLRSNNPEMFKFGSEQLSVAMGGINTAVLIFSSLTMALAVRSAQLGKNKQVVTLLGITFACACVFLIIKYFEYSAKFEHGYVWGGRYAAHAADPDGLHLFFGIYFLMTGLHGIHVLIGMALIAWLIMRAMKGEFNEKNFVAVDLGGLYWHLVDLIWIYLFPLLYLIG